LELRSRSADVRKVSVHSFDEVFFLFLAPSVRRKKKRESDT
jgi:hypothetical protein